MENECFLFLKKIKNSEKMHQNRRRHPKNDLKIEKRIRRIKILIIGDLSGF